MRADVVSDDDTITVSVVMPAFNAAKTISRQLDALARQTTEVRWELIVADNGSTDTTAEVVSRWAGTVPALRVVDASDGRGPSYARNFGARQATGELLLFCDADDVVDPGWIAAMVAAWRGGADLLGGRLDVETRNDPDVLMWRGPIQDTGLPVAYGFMPYSISANFGCTAEAFRRFNGFDESILSASGEDVDICWRAQMQGYTLAFVPNAVVAYLFRHDLGGALRQALGYGASIPGLYKAYRDDGFPRPPLRQQARRIRRHLRKAPMLLQGRGPRGWWLWQSAFLLGRLKGAIENRVLFW